MTYSVLKGIVYDDYRIVRMANHVRWDTMPHAPHQTCTPPEFADWAESTFGLRSDVRPDGVTLWLRSARADVPARIVVTPYAGETPTVWANFVCVTAHVVIQVFEAGEEDDGGLAGTGTPAAYRTAPQDSVLHG